VTGAVERYLLLAAAELCRSGAVQIAGLGRLRRDPAGRPGSVQLQTDLALAMHLRTDAPLRDPPRTPLVDAAAVGGSLDATLAALAAWQRATVERLRRTTVAPLFEHGLLCLRGGIGVSFAPAPQLQLVVAGCQPPPRVDGDALRAVLARHAACAVDEVVDDDRRRLAFGRLVDALDWPTGWIDADGVDAVARTLEGYGPLAGELARGIWPLRWWRREPPARPAAPPPAPPPPPAPSTTLHEDDALRVAARGPTLELSGPRIGARAISSPHVHDAVVVARGTAAWLRLLGAFHGHHAPDAPAGVVVELGPLPAATAEAAATALRVALGLPRPITPAETRALIGRALREWVTVIATFRTRFEAPDLEHVYLRLPPGVASPAQGQRVRAWGLFVGYFGIHTGPPHPGTLYALGWSPA
jgi:hypothetical protein